MRRDGGYDIIIPEATPDHPMDTVTVSDAKAHLEDLIARAARGEDVRISDPLHGTARLTIEAGVSKNSQGRMPGRWKGKLGSLPDELCAPMTATELKDWIGHDA